MAGHRVQIAGSANKTTSAELIRYGHRLVAQIARGVLVEGGGLVLAVGREPRADGGDESSPSLLFDWTALEAAASVLRDGAARWPRAAGLPVVVVASEKAEAEFRMCEGLCARVARQRFRATRIHQARFPVRRRSFVSDRHPLGSFANAGRRNWRRAPCRSLLGRAEVRHSARPAPGCESK